jgi:glyoxylase-like metal-dependent hydrolase (beta-lactamase superfamily II)
VGIETVVSPFLDENCYLVVSPRTGDAVVVDPGVATAAAVNRRMAQEHWRPVAVLATHAHPDHVWDAAEVCQAWNIPAYLHIRDEARLADPLAGLAPFGLPRPGELLGSSPSARWHRPASVETIHTADDGGAHLTLGALGFRVLSCPGHTPGSAVFEVEGAGADPVLLTGDVLFRDGVGRTDLPGGDRAAMRSSLRRLTQTFDHSRVILPGHGPGSTLGREIAHSVYLAEALEA